MRSSEPVNPIVGSLTLWPNLQYLSVSPIPNSWYPAFFFLFLWVQLFHIPHVSEIIWYSIFLSLSDLTQSNTLKFHSCCCKWQDFLFSRGWIIFHHIYIMWIFFMSFMWMLHILLLFTVWHILLLLCFKSFFSLIFSLGSLCTRISESFLSEVQSTAEPIKGILYPCYRVFNPKHFL